MINDDAMIKVARERGYKTTWPDQVIKMKARNYNMKLGFPGIKNDHLSFIEYRNLKLGDIFIYDPYIELGDGAGDEAPMMLKLISPDRCRIEGIGYGIDSIRDPDRIKFRWMDEIDRPNLPDNFLVYLVESRPDLDGGSSYYYFFRSYRDFRI